MLFPAPFFVPECDDMPIQRCERNGEQGWQYGDSGKCYLGSEEGGDNKAKQKAYLQGAAIEGGGPLNETTHMAELDVPVITTGIFNGLQVSDIAGLIEDTKRAMPYLVEAQQIGYYRGEGNERFNSEPVPPFIHLRHYPNDIASEKLREWTSNVEMNPDVRLMNGEDWGFAQFSNVDPELAKLLSVAFPYRSGEFLPHYTNPDTGEVYPVVLRSVAFLDEHTEPAVPQQRGYSVKLAQDGLGVITVHCVPNDNQLQEEIEIMADKEASTVKLSAEDIQRFEAMEERFIKLEKRFSEKEAENKALKGAVNEMKEEKDLLSSQVLKLQQESRVSKIDAYLLKLEKEYDLTPVAIQAIRPVVSAEGGVVKMSEDAEEIPIEQAYMQSLEQVFKLAKDKDALFIPGKVDLPTGKQQVKKLSASEEREQAITKLQADAKERGEDLSYADARMQAVSQSNAILDIIAQGDNGREDS